MLLNPINVFAQDAKKAKPVVKARYVLCVLGEWRLLAPVASIGATFGQKSLFGGIMAVSACEHFEAVDSAAAVNGCPPSSTRKFCIFERLFSTSLSYEMPSSPFR